jgi:hypothetical protein
MSPTEYLDVIIGAGLTKDEEIFLAMTFALSPDAEPEEPDEAVLPWSLTRQAI